MAENRLDLYALALHARYGAYSDPSPRQSGNVDLLNIDAPTPVSIRLEVR